MRLEERLVYYKSLAAKAEASLAVAIDDLRKFQTEVEEYRIPEIIAADVEQRVTEIETAKLSMREAVVREI